MEPMYALMIHTANARLKAALATVSTATVSSSPSAWNSRWRPTCSAVGWNIWVTRTSSRKAVRPRKRIRAVQYAAGSATRITRAVEPPAISRVLARFCPRAVSVQTRVKADQSKWDGR